MITQVIIFAAGAWFGVFVISLLFMASDRRENDRVRQNHRYTVHRDKMDIDTD